MSRPSTFHASASTNQHGQSAHNTSRNEQIEEKSYFEVQREGILRDIGVSMESVLQNINKLNRSLEGIIAVGNEFSSVEALWSHFENVMAPPNASSPDAKDDEAHLHNHGDDDGDGRAAA